MRTVFRQVVVQVLRASCAQMSSSLIIRLETNLPGGFSGSSVKSRRYSLCGILIVRPPTNSRITASFAGQTLVRAGGDDNRSREC